MSQDWQPCPHCKVLSPPRQGSADSAPCPACGKPLGAVTVRWYYARNHQPIGPLSSGQLQELAASGQLAPTDMVVQAGSQKWTIAARVKGLFASVNRSALVPVALPVSLPSPQQRVPEFMPPPQRRRSYELLAALATILLLTLGYVFVARTGVPRPGGLLGHGLGIVGFLMMLSTETLYSLRKRARRFHLGRMATWLQVHIYTGIVGPYLVLLHSGWSFHGLAGILTLLTAAMVVSGFIGRYIYTAVPRSLDGAEVALQELEQRIAADDRRLQALGINAAGLAALRSATAVHRSGWRLVLGRGFLLWRERRRLRRAIQGLENAGHVQAAQARQLLADRYQLEMQLDSLAGTRQLLALWHVIHVPLGVALFLLAFLHVGAALYYGTFLK